jgi:hypothetical protein
LIYPIKGYEEYAPDNKEIVLVIGTSKDKANNQENEEQIKYANYIGIRISDK